MILVDPRAGSGPLIDHPTLHGLAVRANPQLDSGDASFLGNGTDDMPVVTVGVEVKTLSELVASLLNGRANGIDGQFRQLAASYNVRYLCYYGLARPNPDTGALQVGVTWPQKGHPSRLTLEWRDFDSAYAGRAATGEPGGRPEGNRASTVPPRRARYCRWDNDLIKRLVSPSFTALGIHVVHCFDIDEVAAWLRALYEVWQKPYDQHRSMDTFDQSGHNQLRGAAPGMRPRTKRELQVAQTAFSLQHCGVGFDRAWALADVYGQEGRGGIREMFTASVEELAEVRIKDKSGKERRMGKVVAQAIEEAIT